MCTTEADLDRCCVLVVMCDHDLHPELRRLHEPEENLEIINCASNDGRCDARLNLDTCCNPRKKCDEMRRSSSTAAPSTSTSVR